MSLRILRADAEEVSAQAWGASLSGSTEPWTVSVLQALVRLRRPMNILELGTFEGRTTRALAEVMPTHARIWTVDHERRHQGFEDDPRIVFVQQDALEFLTSAPTGCFNFVFIDDSHEYAHVAQEIDMLLDRLVWRPALITGHDVEGAFGLGPLYVDRGGFIIELPLLHAGGSLGVIECP